MVCHNNMQSATEFENALVHELVHAFDHCRGKDLDWENCRHHACSEVRAAQLSGDCSLGQELLRGNLGFRAQTQARRGARSAPPPSLGRGAARGTRAPAGPLPRGFSRARRVCGQACIRRRAELSVSMNPHCQAGNPPGPRRRGHEARAAEGCAATCRGWAGRGLRWRAASRSARETQHPLTECPDRRTFPTEEAAWPSARPSSAPKGPHGGARTEGRSGNRARRLVLL